MSNDNKDKKREVAPSKVGDPHQGPASTTEVTSAIGVTTNAGDKDRKTIDTGDISRASIARGIRSPDGGGSSNVTAADIVKGTTKPEDTISYTTGISAANGKPLNAKTEASITKELDSDISTSTNTEDVSKLVSSGTSSAKSGGIDKDDIYSSDEDGTRHLEKVQQTKTTTDDGEKDT